jgi:hypothetical protein
MIAAQPFSIRWHSGGSIRRSNECPARRKVRTIDLRGTGVVKGNVDVRDSRVVGLSSPLRHFFVMRRVGSRVVRCGRPRKIKVVVASSSGFSRVPCVVLETRHSASSLPSEEGGLTHPFDDQGELQTQSPYVRR